MHADPLPIPDQPGGMLYSHDGRQAVLPRDHRGCPNQLAAPQGPPTMRAPMQAALGAVLFLSEWD
jgi:hypothetical protein